MNKNKQLILGFGALLVAGHAVAQSQLLPVGWSLVGNNAGASFDPVAIFGNAATATAISSSVVTVWTWDKTKGQWNFFTPSMTSQALSTYAASKGYGVLSAIGQGEGFWVNAKNNVTLDLSSLNPPNGSGFPAATSPTSSNIPVDLSASSITRTTATGFQIDNLNIPNVGNFQIPFEWNPSTFQFNPVIAGIKSNGDTCTTAVLTGNASWSVGGNIAGYKYLSRVGSTGEFGAITASSNAAAPMTISWAKTASQDQNPYLVGQALASFDATKGYGVIGNINSVSYPGGFMPGDLIMVAGSLASGAMAIFKVGASASLTMSLARPADVTTDAVLMQTLNCAPVAGGSVTGNISWSSGNVGYSMANFGTNSGSVSTGQSSNADFSASWGNFTPAVLAKLSVGYGFAGSANYVAYPNFASNKTIFGVDIGTGVSITALDATGKTVGTAVFFK